MFKVRLHQSERSWYGFSFEFESMEEAQKFIEAALQHFIVKGDDDDEREILVTSITYSQRFTAEEDKDEE